MNISAQSARPPAIAALDAYPLLRASVEVSLEQQAACVIERNAFFQGRQTLLSDLQQAIATCDSGMIALEGVPGSGVTSILAHLAATNQYAFWFYDEDARQGAAALCAQLIGLHRLQVPLIPPAAQSDPGVLEQFLADISSQRESETPFVVLIDPPACNIQPRDSFRFPVSEFRLPISVPPNMVLVYGCLPDTEFPFEPTIRLSLPQAGNDAVINDQKLYLQATGCAAEWIEPLVAIAGGNFLYASFASAFLQQGLLDISSLKLGLDSLYQAWWSQLDAHSQRLALLLASASEPMPSDICAELLGTAPQPLMTHWAPLVVEAQDTIGFYHWSTRDFLARYYQEALEEVHAEIVALAVHVEQSIGGKGQDPGYMTNQFARHAALGTSYTRNRVLLTVGQRAWIRNQERRSGTLMEASSDLSWELRSASHLEPVQREGVGVGKQMFAIGGLRPTDLPFPISNVRFPLLRLGHDVALSGTLASLARTMSPDVAVAALNAAMEHMGRETALKKVMDCVDQLPDGHAKAQVLRQLGDACYAHRMRNSAMRLLSQALDLEEQHVPRAWRDQRDHLFVTMIQAALSLNEIEAALDMCDYINSLEQRGMAETHIVHRLMEKKELVRARRVACNIGHESMSAWAQAEVAVAAARSGDLFTADMLLADVVIESASSWADVELACDNAAEYEDDAHVRVGRFDNPQQRDNGLTRLSQALAYAGKEQTALQTIARISDIASRLNALLHLRDYLSGSNVLDALNQANRLLDDLPKDERTPLMTMLASAYASKGYRDQAIEVAHRFSEGEERDRAMSRIAVALAQYGDYDESLAMARVLGDDDERDWTLAELTSVLAEAGHWDQAQTLIEEIVDNKDRSRTLANLAIAHARTGEPLYALDFMRSIDMPSERSRALTITAPLFVRTGHSAEAMTMLQEENQKLQARDEHALQLTQISRCFVALALTLAERGQVTEAQEVATHLVRTFDRTRVDLAIARAIAEQDEKQAYALLGASLRSVTDRNQAFRLLEQAIPVFAFLGGGILLVGLAKTIAEMDSWW